MPRITRSASMLLTQTLSHEKSVTPGGTDSLSQNSIDGPSIYVESSTVQSSRKRKRSDGEKPKKQSYKHPRNKGPDHVPRAQNCFFVYRTAFATNPENEKLVKSMNAPALSKHLGCKWNALSDAEKQIWRDRAREIKDQHELDHPGYKYRPQRGNKKGKNDDKEEAQGLTLSNDPMTIPTVPALHFQLTTVSPPREQQVPVSHHRRSTSISSPINIPRGLGKHLDEYSAQSIDFNPPLARQRAATASPSVMRSQGIAREIYGQVSSPQHQPQNASGYQSIIVDHPHRSSTALPVMRLRPPSRYREISTERNAYPPVENSPYDYPTPQEDQEFNASSQYLHPTTAHASRLPPLSRPATAYSPSPFHSPTDVNFNLEASVSNSTQYLHPNTTTASHFLPISRPSTVYSPSPCHTPTDGGFDLEPYVAPACTPQLYDISESVPDVIYADNSAETSAYATNDTGPTYAGGLVLSKEEQEQWAFVESLLPNN